MLLLLLFPFITGIICPYTSCPWHVFLQPRPLARMLGGGPLSRGWSPCGTPPTATAPVGTRAPLARPQGHARVPDVRARGAAMWLLILTAPRTHPLLLLLLLFPFSSLVLIPILPTTSTVFIITAIFLVPRPEAGRHLVRALWQLPRLTTPRTRTRSPCCVSCPLRACTSRRRCQAVLLSRSRPGCCRHSPLLRFVALLLTMTLMVAVMQPYYHQAAAPSRCCHTPRSALLNDALNLILLLIQNTPAPCCCHCCSCCWLLLPAAPATRLPCTVAGAAMWRACSRCAARSSTRHSNDAMVTHGATCGWGDLTSRRGCCSGCCLTILGGWECVWVPSLRLPLVGMCGPGCTPPAGLLLLLLLTMG